MFIRISSLLSTFLITLAFCQTSTITAYAQGFGAIKMVVNLERKHPPKVYIRGTAIGVRIDDSQVARDVGLAQQMASVLESELLSHDQRLKPDNLKPETLISCTITRLESVEKWETRTGESQKGGLAGAILGGILNPQKPGNYKVIAGTMNVSYQAKDIKTGNILDSDNLGAYYSQAFLDGTGAPSLSEVEHGMMWDIVSQIVRRLVPTREKIAVLLPKGKLENAGKLGQAGLWSRMLEQLEMMPPLANPKDDAYRQYDIGVAYEALAYQADNLADARKLLEQAAIYYGRALEMNPEEKYFREPQKRIDTAIAQYKKLEEQQAASQTGGAKDVASGPADKSLTNQDVIDLLKAGLDEENLIATIDVAPAVEFDLSPQGLRHLLENGVSNRVISAMRRRQSPPQKPEASARPAVRRNR